jgi:hypothetical protein
MVRAGVVTGMPCLVVLSASPSRDLCTTTSFRALRPPPAGLKSPADRVVAEAGGDQLRPRDHAVLSPGQPRHSAARSSLPARPP